MGFETLLGNERLKENLTGSLRRGHISHFYLISGPAGSGKHTLAKLLASAILCGGQNAPCGICGPCRKVQDGNHPDFITVTDPEHKNIAVKIVREIRDDVFIRPNESDHKIYLLRPPSWMPSSTAVPPMRVPAPMRAETHCWLLPPP